MDVFTLGHQRRYRSIIDSSHLFGSTTIISGGRRGEITFCSLFTFMLQNIGMM